MPSLESPITLPAEVNGSTPGSLELGSVDGALSAVGVGRHQLLLFMYVGGCWMSDAMEVMLVAVLAPAVACEWGTSPEGQSLLASAVFTGMMLASSAWGVVADLAGRKAAFGAAAGLAAASGLASSLAPSLGWLALLRLLVGAGLVGVLPMYSLLEEWLPRGSGSKGKWLVALQVWWSVGTVLEALLARWLLNSFGWRALLAASALPIVCILAALPWVPESPHYLAASGRAADALRTMELAAARNGTTDRLHRHLQQKQGQLPPPQGQQQRHHRLLQQSSPPRLLPYNSQPQQGHGDARQGYGVPPDCSSSAGLLAASSSAAGTTEVHLEVQAAGSPAADSHSAVSRTCRCRCCDSGIADGSLCDRSCACIAGILPLCHPRTRRDSSPEESTDRTQRQELSGSAWVPGWVGELAGLGRILLGPQLAGRTCRLAVTWFTCALSYYGVAMLVPYVASGGLHRPLTGRASSSGAAADGSGGSCVPWSADGSSSSSGGSSHLVLPSAAYWSMMLAAVAELPGLLWAFLTVDRWSRRRIVALSLAATAAALAPLVMALAGGGGGSAAAASPVPAPPPAAQAAPSPAWRRRRLQPDWLTSSASWWLPLASVTLARLFVSGAFTLLYVLTPEQYPPRVRGSALGAANTLARVGALVAPFLAVALPQRGDLPEALGLMAVACGVAAVAAGGLPDGPKEV